MRMHLTKLFFLLLTTTVVGCSTAPGIVDSVNGFSAQSSQSLESERASCMAEHNSFNRRQLQVSAAALEQAWVYCVNREDIFYSVHPQPEQPSGW